MKQVALITGATGMIGGLVLRNCLESSSIDSVISFSRRSTGILHKKLTEIILEDFRDYSGLEEYFKNIAIAYFCIGVYTGAVSREKFREITVDYTMAFSDMLIRYSPKAAVCFLSGAGADPKEKSRMMFAKDKGIAENYLIRQQFGRLNIFRPGYIYPVTPRIEPNFSYRLSRKLYPLFKTLMPNKVITSEDLAHAISSVGIHGNKKIILENKDISEIAKKTM